MRIEDIQPGLRVVFLFNGAYQDFMEPQRGTVQKCMADIAWVMFDGGFQSPSGETDYGCIPVVPRLILPESAYDLLFQEEPCS